MLGILTADCAPVLFADREARVIGAAHAGWKGALGGVLEATLAAMEGWGRDGTDRRRHRALHLPGQLRSGRGISDRFLKAVDDAVFSSPQTPAISASTWRAMSAAGLARAGIGDIADLGLCTYPQDNGFFSFRRTTHRGESDYGREISAIVLRRATGGEVSVAAGRRAA